MTSSDTEKFLPTLPDWAVAEPRVAVLLKEKGRPAAALEQYGLERFQAGDNARAIEAFAAAARLNPGQPIYSNNLGVALERAGDTKGAVTAFRASLDLDQNQPAIWLNLAYTLRDLGEIDEAEQALITASGHHATAAEALTALGNLASRRGDYDEAAQFLRHAIEADVGSATLHASLGAALFQTGSPIEALAEYEKAAALDAAQPGFKDNADFLTMLNGVTDGDAEGAVTAYARPLDDDAVLVSALNRALVYLATFGHTDAASALVGEWLQYYPEDEEALYFQQIFAGKALKRAPVNFVTHYFDRLADQMDANFARTIDYHVPEYMAALLADVAGEEWRGNILDAGCGSGLLGHAIKPFAKSLIGIDLSPRMVVKARATGLYDSADTADLLTYMQRASAWFDLIVAADSLIYFGALDTIFAAADKALRKGGWFMLSLEAGTEAEDYAVTPNGRFRHARSYVIAAAKGSFRLVRDSDVMLRRQAGRPVDGTIFLFQKM